MAGYYIPLVATPQIGGGGGEGGGGSGVLVVHENYDESADTYTLDKTWQEIKDAGFSVLEVGDSTQASFATILTLNMVPNPPSGYNCVVQYSFPASGEQPAEVDVFSCSQPDDYPGYVANP